MTTEDSTLTDHSELSRKLLVVLEDFIDEVGNRGCTAHLDSVLKNNHYLKGKNLGQKPERFIEDYLIFPILQTLTHTYRPRPVQYAPRWTHGRGIPDFALTTIPVKTAKQKHLRLFGEAKPPNKLNYARSDVEVYLGKDLDFHAVAILTDGIEWELWLRSRRQELAGGYTPFAIASLEQPLMTVKNRNLDREPYRKHDARKQIDVEAFTSFARDGLLEIIHSEFGITTDRP